MNLKVLENLMRKHSITVVFEDVKGDNYFDMKDYISTISRGVLYNYSGIKHNSISFETVKKPYEVFEDMSSKYVKFDFNRQLNTIFVSKKEEC